MASFFKKSFQNRKKRLHLQTKKGDIAQLVEQRTENPCVPGSNPGITTKTSQTCGVFLFLVGCNFILSHRWFTFKEIFKNVLQKPF